MPAKLCAGCHKTLVAKESIQCVTCLQQYDHICANITARRMKLLTVEYKNSWICPGCRAKQPKGDNTNITICSTMRDPDISDLSDSPTVSHVTSRPKRHLDASIENEGSVIDMSASSLRELIKHEIQLGVKEIITEQMRPLKELVIEFQQSMSFFNAQYEEMKASLTEKTHKIDRLENQNLQMTTSLQDLQKRINLMEQHARSNNIEIQCIPENKSENLVSTVMQLSNVLKCNIKESDLSHCTRIAKKDQLSKRPRSVLVRFITPRTRDSLFAAAIKYNKNNPKDRLNTSHLGIAADGVQPIYIVEHLSAYYKAIHAAARTRAKELGFKYVWVRNGRIFMKKTDTSERYTIDNVETLKSLT